MGNVDRRRVLVIGSGGREHALAWALARSSSVEQVIVAPGNAGTSWPAAEGRAAAVSIAVDSADIAGLITLAQEQAVGLTIVGPEVPLALGIVDSFQAAGLLIFGPSKAAAMLESSKAFAKDLMRTQGIPTADYAVFEDFAAAHDYLASRHNLVVIKADGLAAGKGVFVCDDARKERAALRRIMLNGEFGDRHVLIEERLSGPEVSVLAFCDGKTVIPMPSARDHKRINDGDQGPNTGGMGAYAPVPDVDPALIEDIRRTILQPVIDAMAARGTPYIGVLYAGLMLTPDGPKVLEFNCRFGDPETQALLPLLDSDLAEIVLACVEGRLDSIEVRWKAGSCATVVLASPGYPDSYPKGLEISGLNDVQDAIVFHAGTAQHGDSVVTNGGRVLAVSAIGEDLPAALATAYKAIDHIHFDGMHFRRDIGQKTPSTAPAGESDA